MNSFIHAYFLNCHQNSLLRLVILIKISPFYIFFFAFKEPTIYGSMIASCLRILTLSISYFAVLSYNGATWVLIWSGLILCLWNLVSDSHSVLGSLQHLSFGSPQFPATPPLLPLFSHFQSVSVPCDQLFSERLWSKSDLGSWVSMDELIYNKTCDFPNHSSWRIVHF